MRALLVDLCSSAAVRTFYIQAEFSPLSKAFPVFSTSPQHPDAPGINMQRCTLHAAELAPVRFTELEKGSS